MSDLCLSTKIVRTVCTMLCQVNEGANSRYERLKVPAAEVLLADVSASALHHKAQHAHCCLGWCYLKKVLHGLAKRARQRRHCACVPTQRLPSPSMMVNARCSCAATMRQSQACAQLQALHTEVGAVSTQRWGLVALHQHRPASQL